jgi:O-antigen/teichoic acid export membrane protein
MIKKVIKSKFFQNVSISSFSIVIAQILQLLVFLLLTKYITQSELGEYSVYMSYLAIIASVGMLQYQLTIVHIESERLNSSIIISLSIAIILSIFIWLLIEYMVTFDKTLLKFLPIHIFMSFLLSISTYLLVRFEKFVYLAILRVLPIILLMSEILIYHFTIDDKLKLDYLVIFHISAVGLSGVIFFIYSLKLYEKHTVNLKDMIKLLYEKREFALVTTPGVFINSFAYNIPTIIVGNFFGQAMAAQYFLAMRLFNIISIASKSIYDVYHGKLAYFVRNDLKDDSIKFYKNLKKLLLFISIVTLLLFIILPPILVPLFFKVDEWNETIYFLQILSALAAITLYVVPRSIVFVVHEKLKEDFNNHVLLLILVSISWSMAIVLNNVYAGIIIYVILNIIRYVYISLKINKIVKER